MANDLKRLESEEYKGAGKIGNAWAKWTAVGPVAVVAMAITGGLGVLKSIRSAHTEEEAFASMRKWPVISFAAGLAVNVAGAVWGWRQSGRAQEQHKELQEAVKDLRVENEKLVSEKKWVERVAEKQEQHSQTAQR